MIFVLLAICLASVYGRPDGDVEDGDPEVWTGLKSILPVELSEHAEKSGLATKRIFQNTVIQKLHTQVFPILHKIHNFVIKYAQLSYHIQRIWQILFYGNGGYYYYW